MPMMVDRMPSQQIEAERLIIASNRGPVEFYMTQENELKYRRGAGGMVTALIDAGNRMDVTWVAMAMTEGDRVALKQSADGLIQSPLRGQKMQLRYVAIPKMAYRKHYDKVSNQVLWFLQHYLYNPGEPPMPDQRMQDAWINGYTVANRAIADAVCAEIEREESIPVVMLHDYHLYLASAMIRERHPEVVMQQFIHIPWPDARVWHFLPSNISHAIYRGLVGNDIIGFQTQRDARNFIEGARTMLEGAVVDFEEGAIWWHGQRTRVRAYPISISVYEERRIVQSTPGRRAAALIASTRPKTLYAASRRMRRCLTNTPNSLARSSSLPFSSLRARRCLSTSVTQPRCIRSLMRSTDGMEQRPGSQSRPSSRMTARGRWQRCATMTCCSSTPLLTG